MATFLCRLVQNISDTLRKSVHETGGYNLGFTLLELLIVFSIMGILSTASVVSFITYNETQTLANASKDIRQMLLNAKSRAQSHVKPPQCEGKLDGYQVTFCSNVSDCESGGNYEMAAICEGSPLIVSPQEGTNPNLLPRNIKFSETMTSPTTVIFNVLNGGVVGSGNLQIVGYGQERTITIDDSGNVYEN